MTRSFGSRVARQCAAAIVATVVLGNAPVLAASPAEIAVARRLFGEAEKDEANERWAEALEKLEKVVQIKETAGVRFHIAKCHEQLGRLVDALEGYRRAKQLAIDTKADDVLEMVGPEIDRVALRVAQVSVQLPKGIRSFVLKVDESEHDALSPGEFVLVDPGSHKVSIEVEGKVRFERDVALEPGDKETLDVPDWRKPDPKPAPKPEPQPANASVDSSSVPTAAWISFGAGAALGVGGYFAYARADNLARESADVCAASLACDPGRADQVRKWDGLALGMWTGALIGVGTGVTLTLTSGTGRTDTAMVVSPNQVKLRTTF